MDKSKQSAAILSLGKELVGLFSEHGQADFTIAWMAHYLAELMQNAKAEKKSLKKKLLEKECIEIILDLWNKRNRFPDRVRPLSELSHAVAVINALQDKDTEQSYWGKYQGTKTGSVWGDYMYALRTALEDALEISIAASATKETLGVTKKWNKHDPFLHENEKIMIAYLDEILNNKDSRVINVFKQIKQSKQSKAIKPKKAADRMLLAIGRLRAILKTQAEALDDLEKAVVVQKPILIPPRRKNAES